LVRRALADLGLLDDEPRASRGSRLSAPKIAAQPADEERIARAQRIWDESRPITYTLAGAYLGRRAIPASLWASGALRFHAESGGVEQSFDEYAGHHMPADMEFTAAVQFTLEDRGVIMGEDAATVISRSQAHGQFRGQNIHSRTMETMVLRRTDGQWRIVHIHWSSAPITGEHAH
jgi:ketosteroid isomerase-like protein